MRAARGIERRFFLVKLKPLRAFIADPKTAVLNVEVFDHDRISKDDKIGFCAIPLASFLDNPEAEVLMYELDVPGSFAKQNRVEQIVSLLAYWDEGDRHVAAKKQVLTQKARMDTASKVMSSARTHGQDTCSKDPAGCMRAVMWTGKSVKLEHVPKPKIMEASDVVVKVTACSVSPDFATDVCSNGSGLEKNQILGSEAVGVVDSVGAGVQKVKEGDRVAVSFVLACGDCKHCRRQEYAACNCTNASQEFKQTYGGWAPAAVLGSTRMLGNVPGVQAEYVRVPYGDMNCFKLPSGVSDDKALLGVETTATALHAVDMAKVKEGDNVVIWGLGPIGLQAAHWSKLRGAKTVIGVEQCSERLKFAHDHMNLKVIDRRDVSSSQLVTKLQQMLPPGGADAVIDASGCSTSTGFLAKLEKSMGMETQPEPTDTFKEMLMIVRKCGHISIVSDYMCSVQSFPVGHVAMKGVTVNAGRTPAQKYYPQVFDAIASGELDPSVLISHRLALEEVPEAYSRIAKKDSGFLKVFVAPHEMRSKA